MRRWIEARRFAGYDPFDLLNSPWLNGAHTRGMTRRTLPAVAILQAGKRFAGTASRRILRVPPSRNPKALGLCLSAYCDLAQLGYDVSAEAVWLKQELIRLRSPQEADYCWGYDWDYISLRGSRLKAFSPNCIASYFCGLAMLQMAEVFADAEARAMGESAAHFLATRLNRSVEDEHAVCFSYTPTDTTIIYNSSALAGALLARAGASCGNAEYLALARKAMTFLVNAQLPTGAWHYGHLRRQRWIDSFHSSYNVCALLDYQQASGDRTFERSMLLGHRYYQATFFTKEGAPRYFHNRTYPIDIHACSQAVLHFVALSAVDTAAMDRAARALDWTLRNMASEDGSYYYQRHRLWTNRTPYMRWGQAWMLRSIACFARRLDYDASVTPKC